MTDQTTPASWTVTATITVTNRPAAGHTRAQLSKAVHAIADEYEATARTIETHHNPVPIDPYSQSLARAIAAELDRLHLQQAADGLDDQDGPVLRCRLYAESRAYSELSTWACHGDDWWMLRLGLDDPAPRWHPESVPPLQDGLTPLGWVEIPQATGDTATSEEQQ